MDRAALADLLRSRRSRLAPADVGLPSGPRRRTPGLRRDEVAAMAAISSDYYTRLEQQRGPHPSPAVLAAIARALRMSDDERDHLFHLAGQPPPVRRATSTHVSPGMLHVLDHLTDSPAFVVGDLGETIVQNAMSVAVSGDGLAWRGRERSFTWRWFTDPSTRHRFPEQDWPTLSRTHVADLRATYGRRGTDPDVASFVTDLLGASPEFADCGPSTRWPSDGQIRSGSFIPRSGCSTCCARRSSAGWTARHWSSCFLAREPTRGRSWTCCA